MSISIKIEFAHEARMMLLVISIVVGVLNLLKPIL